MRTSLQVRLCRLYLIVISSRKSRRFQDTCKSGDEGIGVSPRKDITAVSVQARGRAGLRIAGAMRGLWCTYLHWLCDEVTVPTLK